MARTEIDGRFIKDKSVRKEDLDTTTPGHSVITSVNVVPPLSMTYTGADPGTGDVTISLEGSTQSSFTLVIARLKSDINNYRAWTSLPFKNVLVDSLEEMEDGKWKPKNPGIYGIFIQLSFSSEAYSPSFKLKINGHDNVLYRGFSYGSSILPFFHIYVKRDNSAEEIDFQFYNTRSLKIYKKYSWLYIWKIADIGAIQ